MNHRIRDDRDTTRQKRNAGDPPRERFAYPTRELITGTGAMENIEDQGGTQPVSDRTGRDGVFPPGSVMGRYVVLEPIGRGTMGEVHAAYDVDLDRKVALKVVSRVAGTSVAAAASEARLMREARAMAQLAHPNIVTVHEVGQFAGQVFVAMEFVDGATLADRMDSRPGQREVVELFIQAGRGLAAAHAAGLVHRDFKPANVLVGRDGRVRVTDFGLARADESADRAIPSPALTGITQTGVLIGTPAYMAPEQHLRQTIDARSDQFNFCVALYEGLYGERPFAGEALPELAAAVVAGRMREPPADAKVPARLRRIVLRGLRVDPDARYPSMEALLRDLERDPRAARRRWIATAIAMTIVAAGTIGWTARPAATPVCRGADRKLAGLWDPARKLQVRAAFAATGAPYADDAWRAVEHRLDRYAASWVAASTEACEDTRVRGTQSEALLDLRIECLRHRLADLQAQVEVFAAANTDVVSRAVHAAAALSDLASCSDGPSLRAAVPPPADPVVRVKLDELRARVGRARALGSAGQIREGLALLDPVAGQAAALHYRPVEAAAYLQLGQLHVASGQFAQAQSALEHAELAAEAARGSELQAWAAVELVDVERRQGHLERAHDWERRARAALEASGGNDEIEGTLMTRLGTLTRTEGKLEAGLAQLRQGRTLLERARGPDHPRLVASLTAIAFALQEQANYQDATQQLRQALDLALRAFGPRHPDTARAQVNLGQVLAYQGHHDEALALDRQALGVLEQAFGVDSVELVDPLSSIANELAYESRYAEATDQLRRALAIAQTKLAPDNPRVGAVLLGLGGIVCFLGRYDEALDLARRGLAIFEHTFGPEHPYVGKAWDYLATIYNEQGASDQAVAAARRSLALSERAHGGEDLLLAYTMSNLAEALRATGANDEALAWHRKALVLFERIAGPQDLTAGESVLHIGDALVAAGRAEEAGVAFERARGLVEARRGPGHIDLAAPLTGLGRVALSRGQASRAIELVEAALAIAERNADRVTPRQLAEIRFVLARALWAGGGDRARARELARQAADGQARRKGPEPAEIRAWLARH
jgi:tetratricopeptide (TPR) repeat protein